MIDSKRGCVFFNYGSSHALRLLVSIFTLREVYEGPITTFLNRDDSAARLASDLARLGSQVEWIDQVGKSTDRHRLFEMSPYATTLVFDSDLIFLSPIDELWEHAEREGVLVTRFFPNPYGVGGSAATPGMSTRVEFLEGVRGLVDGPVFSSAMKRLLEDRVDINVGVMGISRPKGQDFLTEWGSGMERGRPQQVILLDEMLVVALVGQHRHHLAGEEWNCPADEFFRKTNLDDAKVLHFFAEGHNVSGIRLGRNHATWAGKKWFAAYRRAGRQVNLRRWKFSDPTFPWRAERALYTSAGLSLLRRPVSTTRGILANRKARKN